MWLMTGGRTYDRRGCLKKEDKYGQGIEKPDGWPPYDRPITFSINTGMFMF